MSDLDFEYRLERLYAQAPTYSDEARFAQRIETRLDRAWTVRRLAIGAAGVAGGVFAAVQMLGSGVGARMETAGVNAFAELQRGANNLVAPEWKTMSYLPYGTEVLWMGAALAILAVALLATRSIEEI